jgi:hypothetical protein
MFYSLWPHKVSSPVAGLVQFRHWSLQCCYDVVIKGGVIKYELLAASSILILVPGFMKSDHLVWMMLAYVMQRRRKDMQFVMK